MAAKPRILAFAGSTREHSFNKKLVRIGVAGAQAAGAEVTLIDLRDFPMPLYDGDLEAREGVPANARKLKTLMKSHGGFLISSPEYNSSVPGVLKNAIDWASREEPGETPLVCFEGKVVALMSASPGWLGGTRNLAVLRLMLGNIGSVVLPDPVSVPRAAEAFNPDGTLKDARRQAAAERLGATLANMLVKLGP